jgi:hypothetical protein
VKKHISDQIINYLKTNSIQNAHAQNPAITITNWKKKLLEGISKQEQDNYSLEKYLWHMFSFNLKPSLQGTSAISKYQNQFFKSFYLIIYQEGMVILCNSDKCIPYHDLLAIKAEMKKNHDIYITHQNFKWTFVIPHEISFGPYLYME